MNATRLPPIPVRVIITQDEEATAAGVPGQPVVYKVQLVRETMEGELKLDLRGGMGLELANQYVQSCLKFLDPEYPRTVVIQTVEQREKPAWP